MKHIVKFLFILFLVPITLLATEMNGKYTKTKTVNKEFNVSTNALVNLRNKYGSIDIKTWEKNQVSVEIIITTNGNNESKVEQRLKNISIFFNNSSEEVSIKTHFEKQNNSWIIFGRNSSVNMNIKYFIRMPVSNSLNVYMDYGDVMLDELKGKASIDCDYGKIYVGRLLNDSNYINLDYSRGSTINYMKSGKININYTTLDVEETGNVDLNTDYSNTTFGKVNTLKFNSDYGNLVVEEVNSVIGNSDYVHLKFGEIANNITIDADYGNISIKEMGANFKLVDIDSQYASIKIGINNNSSFSLIADTQYANIKVPVTFNFTREIVKNSKKHYEGTYNGSNGDIKIRSQYGNIKITEN